ncbi:MAG: hypothetical protein R6W70_04575 [bacterium]
MKKIWYFYLILIMGTVFAIFAACSDSGDDGDKSEDSGEGGAVCGNGIVEEGEECEPGDEIRCWELGHYYDTAAYCNDSCEWDLSTCQKRDEDDLCGNGVLDDREICEMGWTESCEEISDSYTGGEATCKQNCLGWDTSECETTGSRPCSHIVTCVQGCAGDEDCVEACKEDGSESGVSNFESYASCMESNCSGLDDSECAQNNCYDSYYACYPGEKCGNGVIDDDEVCEKGDTKPCGDIEEKEYRPKNEAVCNSTCSGWDTYSCIGVDELDCWGLKGCITDCEGDEDCISDCESQAFMKATEIYETMIACHEENCPGGDEECVRENCSYQTDNCMTHVTCGNGIVDEENGEVCEKAETIDCGEIKDNSGESIYEAGTGTAFCNNVCTEYDPMGCHKFCSCQKVKECVETRCGGQDTEDSDCIKECKSEGSEKGEGEYSAWRSCVESCSEENGPSGWDSQNCIDHCSGEISCGNETHEKCEL